MENWIIILDGTETNIDTGSGIYSENNYVNKKRL